MVDRLFLHYSIFNGMARSVALAERQKNIVLFAPRRKNEEWRLVDKELKMQMSGTKTYFHFEFRSNAKLYKTQDANVFKKWI